MSTEDDLRWVDQVVVPTSVAVSDAGVVCHVRSSTDLGEDRRVHELWIGAGGEARRLTDGPDDREPAWQPGGEVLAFVRRRDGRPELWTVEVGSATMQMVCGAVRPLGATRWSPDGRRLLVVSETDDGRGAEGAPVVISERGYRVDGDGLRSGRWTSAVVVDLVSGEPIQISPDGWCVTSAAWSPDGSEVAFTALGPWGDDHPAASRVYVAPAGGGAPRAVSSASGTAHDVLWPAGSGPVWVGRATGAVGLDRLLTAGPDGAVIDLLESIDRSVATGGPGYPGAAPVIDGEPGAVLVAVREEGGSAIYSCRVDRARPPLLVGGDGTTYVLGFDVDPSSGAAIVAVATPGSCGEIERWGVGGPAEMLTSFSSRLGAVSGQVVPERRIFRLSEGATVAAWLLRPADVTGPVPLLVDLHGGPHNAWSPALGAADGYHQALVARGWAVLLPDPRGSDGYGRAYLTSNLGRWGRGDSPDVLEPVDALVAEGVADGARLAVAGYSYGGYLTCWLTATSDRFAAAVAGGCISDLTSMVTSASLSALIDDVKATPWSDHAALDDQSPYRRVDRVRTPTLLLHGLEDAICPPQQAEQWFTALHAQGVATELVLYPGAGHSFLHDGRPSHRRDYATRVVDWLERHVQGRPDT